MASYRIFLCCVHTVCIWEYESFSILKRIGHLKCSFCSPGTHLVAMATLLLKDVHCLFSENVKKIASFSVMLSFYIISSDLELASKIKRLYQILTKSVDI